MKVAAAYIRVSTEDQIEYSPDSQLQELRSYAERHDMVLDPSHVYIDAGISGRQAKKRPAFQSMIATAKSKPSPFEVVLVWKYSRFARNQEESILYKSLLKKECGVDVVSITEETGDSMFGGLIERIIEWMDEFYSVRLSEEVRTKMTFVAETGKVQTVACYGYSKKPGEEPVIVSDEAKWVRFIFSQIKAGKSFLWIARQLNDAGQRTHRGGLFENRTIEYIAHNPIYKGYVRWTPTGKTLSRRIYDSPDTLVAKGNFEPIIPEEEFDAVQLLLEQRRRSRKKNDQPMTVKKHWLSGLLKCSSCGATLTYSPKNDGFQCYKYSKGVCKASHFVKAGKIEAAVIEAISRVTVTGEFIKENTKIPESDLIDYASDIKNRRRVLERAKAAYIAGIDTLEEYGGHKKKIEAEIAALEAKDKAQREAVKLPTKEEVEERFSSVIDALTGNFENEAKQNALKSIVERIVYDKANSTVSVFFYL